MKVILIANTCWNIYNFRKGLVHHFLLNGDEVLVLAPTDDYTERVCSWGIRWLDVSLDQTGTNPIKDLAYFMKIRKIFASEKPDVVLSYTIKPNIYSSLASKITHVPVICNLSGLGTVFLAKGVTGRIAKMLYKFSFQFSSHIFFQNNDDERLFVSWAKVDDAKTSVLPGSGIDLNQFKPAPYKKIGTTKVLMIARIIIEKGVREYAEAASFFAKDKSVTFTLIGKFEQQHARAIDKKELAHWVDAGWLQYHKHSDNISQIIADHDVIVLPSYREGTARILLEGAAIARPLMASDVPGCREVIREGYNGFLFEVKNGKSLIEKLKLFLSLNQKAREKLATNSRTLVEETYDERIVIDAYKKIIHSITD